jgi:ribonuclease D
MASRWLWVDNLRKSDIARKDIQTASVICLDTEYDSYRYFREKLCLVQVKTPSVTYLFDPLDGTDFSFLGESFYNPAVLKVMHAGDNDIRILKRDYGFEFQNIFDTHRAASLLGCHYLSLSTLVNLYLGQYLDKPKNIQRSRWETRPLTEKQICYAVQDTMFLVPLYEKLHEEIVKKRLGKKAASAFEIMAAVIWHEKIFDPQGHLKLRGYQYLTEYQKQNLKRLFRWRFEKAKETNRALFMVLSDQEMVDLIKLA